MEICQEEGEHYKMEEYFDRLHRCMQEYGISLDYEMSIVLKESLMKFLGKEAYADIHV